MPFFLRESTSASSVPNVSALTTTPSLSVFIFIDSTSCITFNLASLISDLNAIFLKRINKRLKCSQRVCLNHNTFTICLYFYRLNFLYHFQFGFVNLGGIVDNINGRPSYYSF